MDDDANAVEVTSDAEPPCCEIRSRFTGEHMRGLPIIENHKPRRSPDEEPSWPNGYKWEGSRLYAQLPTIPRTPSPVPWLTSLHATEGRGAYGHSAFRGNCSGLLIHDLLRFFRPRRVLDPMTGSGTCRDVCVELEIPCVSFDLQQGI